MTFNHLINLSLAPLHPAAPTAQAVLDIHATKASKLPFKHFIEVCGPNVRSLLASIAVCQDPGLPSC